MNTIAVCQSEFLAAEDLPNGKLGIVIAGIEPAPKPLDTGKKSKKSNRPNREVLLTRARGKSLVLNPTNQWAIALLLGTTDWHQWIGKRISLITDIDVNVETQEPCRSIRVAGSPDATPERAEALKKAWQGKRERGWLCRRYKRAYRMLCGPIPERIAQDDDAMMIEPPDPIPEDEQPPERYAPSIEEDEFVDDGSVPADKEPPLRVPGEDDI